MTSRIETTLRAIVVAAFCLPAVAGFVRAVATTTGHAANSGQPTDLAILQADGDTVSGSVVNNTCGGGVHPTISQPAADMAIVIETDPTGQCVGSSPPSSLTILLRKAGTWQPEAGFPASTYRLGPVHAGRPDIVAGYPPFHHDCPVVAWDGQHYRTTRACDDGRAR